jgi:hypothetical protein
VDTWRFRSFWASPSLTPTKPKFLLISCWEITFLVSSKAALNYTSSFIMILQDQIYPLPSTAVNAIMMPDSITKRVLSHQSQSCYVRKWGQYTGSDSIMCIILAEVITLENYRL